jgi:hypothetical protein
MAHIVFYPSADAPGTDSTWSVYREEYVTPNAAEPIDGSQSLVISGLPTMEVAEQLIATLSRLEYLRSRIHAECISMSELADLQSLAPHIQAGDVELLEWAGVSEEQARAEGRI